MMNRGNAEVVEKVVLHRMNCTDAETGAAGYRVLEVYHAGVGLEAGTRAVDDRNRYMVAPQNLLL